MEILNVIAKNYIPNSIGFISGFFGPKGDVGYVMQVDWDKAKTIIELLIAQGRNIESALVGLDGDWSVNSMIVYQDEIFTPYNMYGGSKWATPILIVNYTDSPSETYEVWSKLDIENEEVPSKKRRNSKKKK